MTKQIDKKIKATKILTAINAGLAFLITLGVILLLSELVPPFKDYDPNGVLLELLLLIVGGGSLIILGISIALIVLAAKAKFAGGFANKTIIIYNAILGLIPLLIVVGVVLIAQFAQGSKTINADGLFVLLGIILNVVTVGLGTLSAVEAAKIK